MLRSKSLAKGMMTALATGALALPMVAGAQDNRPVVVVFTFQNSALGAAHTDFDNISTAVQDMLITDMASNAKIRLVDRSHIAEIQAEQNMVKGGMIDPQTAIRIGKLMGAQYAVTGGWIADKAGKAILTGRTIDMETSQISNPQKIEGSADNVLAMIGDLSSKLNGGLNLAPKPGAPARKTGDAGDAKQSGTPTGTKEAKPATKAAAVVQYAKPQSEKSKNVKLDPSTLKLYSSALDELDRKNNAKAKDLLQQVLKKYDGWEPAQRALDKIS
ncbi:MAG TPA: CsgG/HfaB family protein [Gemmatimonadaceae bacterium]|jgi:TolB-like protein